MKTTPKAQYLLDAISLLLGHAPDEIPTWADLAQQTTPLLAMKQAMQPP